jgi:hypothetical protein
MPTGWSGLFAGLASLVCGAAAAADWPMVRGDVRHTGFVSADLRPPFRLAWVREIDGECLGTAMEPILAGDKVLVATHAGNLYALRAQSGEAVWRFEAHGAFLHSPAVVDGLVVAGSTDGELYAVDLETGKLQWHCSAGYGGFSAANPSLPRDDPQPIIPSQLVRRPGRRSLSIRPIALRCSRRPRTDSIADGMDFSLRTS